VTRHRKGGDHTLAALNSIRAAHPAGAPIYVLVDNFSANETPKIRAWAGPATGSSCASPRPTPPGPNPIESQFGTLHTFTMSASNHPNHTVLAPRLQDYLPWRNTNARHPDVRAAQRPERAESAAGTPAMPGWTSYSDRPARAALAC
jgi:hypothetical protein